MGQEHGNLGGNNGILHLRGVQIYRGFLSQDDQIELIHQIRDVAKAAPMFSPSVQGGKKMSVRMTSAGKFGWYSDGAGYRYAPRHPRGGPWPDIPPKAMEIWRAMVGIGAREPECCLINYYGEGARMGMHQDRDEADFQWPVVSVSLGDEGLFRVGNVERGGKSESFWLCSGDVVVLGGDARLVHHGVDRIRFGSSTVLDKGGRINITMRVVT